MLCPNCGAQLPDTALMCYNCRVSFQFDKTDMHVEKIKNGVKKLFNYDLTDGIDKSDIQNAFGYTPKPKNASNNVQPKPDYRPKPEVLDSKTDKFLTLCYMWNLIGSVIIMCGVFAPYFTVYGYPIYIHYGLNIKAYDGKFLIIFTPVFIVFAANAYRSSTRVDGATCIVLGVIGLICVFVYNNLMLKGTTDSSVYSEYLSITDNITYGSGFYMIIIGYIITILAGIVTISGLYMNKES